MDGMTNEEIINIVTNIRHKIDKGETIDESDKEIDSFKKRYPTLFCMATNKDTNFDFKSFELMMSMRQKIIDGDETIDSSSRKIGMDFFKKFHPNTKGI